MRRRRRDLDDLLELLGEMFHKIIFAFSTLVFGILTTFEDSMRVPLHDLGMPPPLQTIAIVLIPALSLVVILRWMRGFVRFVLVGLLACMFFHASWPLVSSFFV